MNDTTARDELAMIIWDCEDLNRAVLADCKDIATEILEAGFRPPARTVTTVEELDALPDDTLLLTARHLSNLVYEVEDGEAWLAGYGYGIRLDPELLPATVIYEPEEGE